jgi:hypothetical protein
VNDVDPVVEKPAVDSELEQDFLKTYRLVKVLDADSDVI